MKSFRVFLLASAILATSFVKAERSNANDTARFIVRMKNGYKPDMMESYFANLDSAAALASDIPSTPRKSFNIGDLNGYVVEMSRAQAEAMKERVDIEDIQEDEDFNWPDQPDAGEDIDENDFSAASTTRTNYFWGLDRIDQATLPLNRKYNYPSEGGRDVTVYVIDTGIDVDHSDFEGRAVMGKVVAPRASAKDLKGHGTHIAGIIGGKNAGVAKKVQLVGVKCLDDTGKGSDSSIITGLQWAVQDCATRNSGKRCIVNLSINSESSRSSINAAVDAASRSGLLVVVAAGNAGKDAANSSPAAASTPIVVGASDKQDKVAKFSNWGPRVSLFAPGVDILSVKAGSKTGYTTLSGTSQSAPHVAGAAALIWSQHPKWTNDQVKAALLDDTVPNTIRFPEGLYSIVNTNSRKAMTTRRLVQVE